MESVSHKKKMCATIASMKTPKTPTSSKTVRLPDPSWPKLRTLMNRKGRAWLVKLIDREHAKLLAQPVPEDASHG